jgi:hypothetical protein
LKSARSGQFVLLCAVLAGCGSTTGSDGGIRRLSWGDPDLQGVWDYRTATPLATPATLGERIQFSEVEKNEFEAGSAARGEAFVRSVGNFVGDEPWADRGEQLTEGARAALIIDPPDGRMPQRTAFGRKLAGQYFSQLSGTTTEGPEVRTVLERCIVAPLVPLRPLNFNNNVKIIQSPDHVVILNEMVHDARIVPIHRSAVRVDSNPLPRWLGQSLGHWEGDTLVVVTSGFRDYPNLLGTSANMHLVERFTAAGPSQLIYEFTVTDPEVFVRPWTARQTLARLDGRIYEYACHEGNVSMTLMLRGARMAELEQLPEEAE